MKNYRNRISLLSFRALALVLISSSVVFTSCKDDDEDDTPTPTPTTSKLMVTHASPDAPGVDLLVDGTKVNSAALEFPNSTSYLTVNSGNRNIKVNVTGTTTTVIDATPAFTANKSYSIFAVDEVASISAIVIEDDLTSPASGKAHIRFIHLSPDAPAVDVALDGGAVVFGDYTFKEVSAFTPLDAGTYDLEVRVAGTTTVALDLDPITLTAGKIYTVFAKGFLTGTGTQALGAQVISNN